MHCLVECSGQVLFYYYCPANLTLFYFPLILFLTATPSRALVSAVVAFLFVSSKFMAELVTMFEFDAQFLTDIRVSEAFVLLVPEAFVFRSVWMWVAAVMPLAMLACHLCIRIPVLAAESSAQR